MSQPVVHFEISAKNREQAGKFYGDLFGWKMDAPPGMDYTLVHPANDKSIGGGIGPVQAGQSPSVTFYVMVDDLQAYLTKAEKLGGKTVVPPMPIPGYGSMAMFADLDGNVIGLFKGAQ